MIIIKIVIIKLLLDKEFQVENMKQDLKSFYIEIKELFMVKLYYKMCVYIKSFRVEIQKSKIFYFFKL